MCNLAVGITCSVLGLALVGVSSYIGFGLIPIIIRRTIINEVVLFNDTEQFERFEVVPFPLTLNVRLFNITNPDDVLAGGVPIVNEVGPYVYKLTNARDIYEFEEDLLKYLRLETLEFDPVASYPLSDNDSITIVNVAYHSILQAAEDAFPSLLFAVNAAIGSIFGEHTSPIMTLRVGDLLLDGVPLCKDPGNIAGVVCGVIAIIGASVRNLEQLDDGSLSFSILSYKDNIPSEEYVVNRGVEDTYNLARILTYNMSDRFFNWVDDVTEEGNTSTSVCNMLNGTDSGVFHPFISRDEKLYAINTDICRSVELRYQYDTEVEGIPVVRFSANEWIFADDDGCFCLNMTVGITQNNGCLYPGATELYSCIGAFLVLSYPHFLYADQIYRNGVIGLNPIEENHRIFLDLEPNTGTIVRGYKRAQFNIFMRPVPSVPATQNLRTTLMPILWVEEGMSLPEEYIDMLKDLLIRPLNLVNILVPIIISICCLLAVIGLVILVRVQCSKKNNSQTAMPLPDNAVLSN